jgi:hypothetical protein
MPATLRVLLCLALIALLGGCLPIGIRGSNLPFAQHSDARI